MRARTRTRGRELECESEDENARVRARTREREQERECKVLITRCQGRETKYEVKRRDLRSQRDSDTRGEVLLF